MWRPFGYYGFRTIFLSVRKTTRGRFEYRIEFTCWKCSRIALNSAPIEFYNYAIYHVGIIRVTRFVWTYIPNYLFSSVIIYADGHGGAAVLLVSKLCYYYIMHDHLSE